MDDTIYFAVGFKSYDITRTSGTAGEWYDWTERSRKSITRISFTGKAMEWISSIMREASKAKGNTVRRWKKKDDFTEIYCARNFNKYGRYISLINVRGKRRAVIIVPELSFNSGWSGIAEKIGRFIHSYKHVGNLETHRLVDSDIPYVDMLKSSKWTNKGRKDMPEKIIKGAGQNLH
uniref:Putative ovule protein n=1 Tax=Solanum chacoense TaxID=4108 RepID=A0A0V0IMC6_SOLCH